VFVLGHLDGETAILHLQRTVLPTEKAERIVSSLEDVNFFLENQPVCSHRFETVIDELVLLCAWSLAKGFGWRQPTRPSHQSNLPCDRDTHQEIYRSGEEACSGDSGEVPEGGRALYREFPSFEN